MSGINQGVIFTVCRLKCHFRDDIGNPKLISGTGFWVKTTTDDLFITNRHNVDAKLGLGPDTKYKLEKLEIELRKTSEPDAYHKETKFFNFSIDDSIIYPSDKADVVAIKSQARLEQCVEYSYKTFNYIDIADLTYLKNSVSLMDIASFIGYPGTTTSKWWDQEWNFGVARVVNIASHPAVPFTHPDILTDNINLVSGLSFSGSSGSVVLLHEKGIKIGLGLSGGNYVSPKIIGLMSGHWQKETDDPQILKHSGLSYFTRSDSILEILEEPNKQSRDKRVIAR